MKRDPIKYGKPIPVRLPIDVLDRVDALAKRISESRATIMRIALKVGLDNLEKALAASDPKLSSLLYPSKPDEGYTLNDEKKKKAG